MVDFIEILLGDDAQTKEKELDLELTESSASDGMDSEEAKKQKYEYEAKIWEFLFNFEEYKLDLDHTTQFLLKKEMQMSVMINLSEEYSLQLQEDMKQKRGKYISHKNLTEEMCK